MRAATPATVHLYLRTSRAFCLAAVAGLAWAPECLEAQAIDFRFLGIDMFGGAAWAAESDMGVAFGSRLGFADLIGRRLRLGFELDWWSAEHRAPDLAVRDAMGGLALWIDVGRGHALRPFLGGGASLHWIDVSLEGTAFPDEESLAAEELEGVRLGASGFAGAALRLSRTGAIWLVVEYRYTSITDLPYHEARLGFRLGGGDA
ncbi:MAG: hypothetical protein PVI01_03995 [Gemmatimonadales bacterium]